MPYDKETRDALQAYYETHDFTGKIPTFDDKKYTPAQLQIYAKAKKFFAQSWLKLLPELVSSCMALCSGRNKNETAIKAQVAD